MRTNFIFQHANTSDVQLTLTYHHAKQKSGSVAPPAITSETLTISSKSELLNHYDRIKTLLMNTAHTRGITQTIFISLAGKVHSQEIAPLETDSIHALAEHINNIAFTKKPEVKNWALILRKI